MIDVSIGGHLSFTQGTSSLLYTLGNLPDLLGRMCTRVARIGFEAVDRDSLNVHDTLLPRGGRVWRARAQVQLIFFGLSGSDHVQADGFAHLQVFTTYSTIGQVVQFTGCGHR